MAEERTCIVICGPTAVGKTRVAIELAKHLGTSIISADSRQCYRELNVGVARPSEKELDECPHYFIASHSIHENITAAYFEKYALNLCEELFCANNTIVMVGGTGLYIKAFCEGLDEIPPADNEIRKAVEKEYENGGIRQLALTLKEKDPLYYTHGEMQNPRRMTRALEVILQTGRSILSYHSRSTAPRPFRIIKIGLELPRVELYKRINLRTDEMMRNGLLEEVKSLLPFKNLQALHTVGYTELFNYLEGRISLEQAIELIRRNTRRYAKRQLTWFKKDAEMNWFPPDVPQLIKFLQKENAGF